MKYLFTLFAITMLLAFTGMTSYQSSVIAQQKTLIEQMITNPACMMPQEKK